MANVPGPNRSLRLNRNFAVALRIADIGGMRKILIIGCDKFPWHFVKSESGHLLEAARHLRSLLVEARAS
jgi:hypothetical protein